MRKIGYGLVTLLSVGVAGYAVVTYGLFPLGSLVHPEMRQVFETNRLGIYSHIFGSAVALALGPLQFSERLRRRRPALHVWSGRLYLTLGVLIGGVSGLYMATRAYGGIVSHLGFGILALLWLFTGYRAYAAVRAREIDVHRRWMIRNFALTLAAVTLRIYLPLSMAAGFDFDIAYPAISWLCWVPNLALAQWLVSERRALAA